MPDVPWVKWFPRKWLSEPSLSMCDVATQGVWANALNAMFLNNTASVSGTVEQLARLCRCRDDQMRVAILELTKYKVADIEEQTGCTIIRCRKLVREHGIRNLRASSARLRWCKTDANGMQTDFCSSLSPLHPPIPPTLSNTSELTREEERGAGERRREPPTRDAVRLRAVKIGLAEVEADKFYDYYSANGWRVGRNPMVSWYSALANWKRGVDERRYNNNHKPNEPTACDKIIMQREYERVLEKLRTIRSTYGDHQTWSPKDREEWKRLVARRDELKKKLGIVI